MRPDFAPAADVANDYSYIARSTGIGISRDNMGRPPTPSAGARSTYYSDTHGPTLVAGSSVNLPSYTLVVYNRINSTGIWKFAITWSDYELLLHYGTDTSLLHGPSKIFSLPRTANLWPTIQWPATFTTYGDTRLTAIFPASMSIPIAGWHLLADGRSRGGVVHREVSPLLLQPNRLRSLRLQAHWCSQITPFVGVHNASTFRQARNARHVVGP